MTLDYYRIFYYVARYKSFSRIFIQRVMLGWLLPSISAALEKLLNGQHNRKCGNNLKS